MGDFKFLRIQLKNRLKGICIHLIRENFDLKNKLRILLN
jgi:hypothetical protein